jgi:hypothetical protein
MHSVAEKQSLGSPPSADIPLSQKRRHMRRQELSILATNRFPVLRRHSLFRQKPLRNRFRETALVEAAALPCLSWLSQSTFPTGMRFQATAKPMMINTAASARGTAWPLSRGVKVGTVTKV